MGFMPGKCPYCGANLTLDTSKDAAICEYCGSPFVVEKAITHVNIENISANNVNIDRAGKVNTHGTTNINRAEKVHVTEKKTVEQHIHNPKSPFTTLAEGVSKAMQIEAEHAARRADQISEATKPFDTAMFGIMTVIFGALAVGLVVGVFYMIGTMARWGKEFEEDKQQIADSAKYIYEEVQKNKTDIENEIPNAQVVENEEKQGYITYETDHVSFECPDYWEVVEQTDGGYELCPGDYSARLIVEYIENEAVDYAGQEGVDAFKRVYENNGFEIELVENREFKGWKGTWIVTERQYNDSDEKFMMYFFSAVDPKNERNTVMIGFCQSEESTIDYYDDYIKTIEGVQTK